MSCACNRNAFRVGKFALHVATIAVAGRLSKNDVGRSVSSQSKRITDVGDLEEGVGNGVATQDPVWLLACRAAGRCMLEAALDGSVARVCELPRSFAERWCRSAPLARARGSGSSDSVLREDSSSVPSGTRVLHSESTLLPGDSPACDLGSDCSSFLCTAATSVHLCSRGLLAGTTSGVGCMFAGFGCAGMARRLAGAQETRAGANLADPGRSHKVVRGAPTTMPDAPRVAQSVARGAGSWLVERQPRATPGW